MLRSATLEDVKWQPEEPLSSQFPRRSRKPLILWLILSAILLAISASILFQLWRTETTDDAQISGHILPISARVSGSVTRILVENDQTVEEGQPLVIIDPSDFSETVNERAADVEQLKASLQVAKDNAESARVNRDKRIKAAIEGVTVANSRKVASTAQEQAVRSQLAAAQATNEQQESNLRRITALYKEQIVSQQVYKDAVASAAVALKTLESERALVESANANLKLEEANRKTAVITLEQARDSLFDVNAAAHTVGMRKAALELAEAQLREAQLQHQRTIIRSPVHGIVAARVVELGQNIQSGDVLLSVVDTSKLWVTANFKETQLKSLFIGEPATVSIDAFRTQEPGRIVGFGGGSGSIFSLIPPDNASGNFVKVVQRIPVRIEFTSSPKEPLRPGMSVVVHIKR